jgi:hypothetical protein
MTADLVSSAAYEIQLTADCELLHSCAARGRKTGETMFPPLAPFFLGTVRRAVGSAPGVTRSRLRARLARHPDGLKIWVLEEAADCLAGDSEAYDPARAVDVGDRVGGDKAAMA